MARYGFSGEKLDMMKLILFVLRTLPAPLPDGELSGVVLLDDNANYFVFADALEDLIMREQLTRDENGFATLTERGRENAAAIESSIASALRRACVESIREVSERFRRDSLISTRTITTNGETYFEGEFSDGQAPLMTVRLLLGNADQARLIEKNFRAGVENVYAKLWESLL